MSKSPQGTSTHDELVVATINEIRQLRHEQSQVHSKRKLPKPKPLPLPEPVKLSEATRHNLDNIDKESEQARKAAQREEALNTTMLDVMKAFYG